MYKTGDKNWNPMSLFKWAKHCEMLVFYLLCFHLHLVTEVVCHIVGEVGKGSLMYTNKTLSGYKELAQYKEQNICTFANRNDGKN